MTKRRWTKEHKNTEMGNQSMQMRSTKRKQTHSFIIILIMIIIIYKAFN